MEEEALSEAMKELGYQRTLKELEPLPNSLSAKTSISASFFSSGRDFGSKKTAVVSNESIPKYFASFSNAF